MIRTPIIAMILLASTVRADDWPQWLGPQRDGVWRETGIVETFPAGGPVVRWRVAIGAGYAGPVVAGERVLVMDRAGAADTPKSVGVAGIGKRYDTVGHERVLCFEAATGKTLWKHEYVRRYDIAYPSGPRATPVVDAGKVFTQDKHPGKSFVFIGNSISNPLRLVDPLAKTVGHPQHRQEEIYILGASPAYNWEHPEGNHWPQKLAADKPWDAMLILCGAPKDTTYAPKFAGANVPRQTAGCRPPTPENYRIPVAAVGGY